MVYARYTALLVLIFAASVRAADDLNQINLLGQADFRNLSEDLGAALSYKAVVPAEPLGITGFDISLEVTATKLQHPGAWDRATSGGAPSTLYLPKVHVHKGLPLGLDVGAFYTSAPDTNISLWGAEVRYALVAGGVATPAVGIRATYSKLSGVDQLNFETRGVELSVSKGFAFFTPYAGIGRLWIDSEPVGAPTLAKEDFQQTKTYVGGNFNFGIANLAIEADRTGGATSYNAKYGFRF